MKTLQLQNITIQKEDTKIIDAVTTTLHPSKLYVVVGPNGAGKSTLIKAIANLIDYSGKIALANKVLEKKDYATNAKIVAMMAQSQELAPLKVDELLSLGRRPFCGNSLQDKDFAIIEAAIQTLKLQPLLHRDLNTLSGGERQRVYLAKSLIQTPQVLLLDEPTSHLDPKAQMDILDTIKKQTLTHKLITVVVMHDLQSALHYGDELLMIKDGKMLYQTKSCDVSEKMLSSVFDLECTLFKNSGHPFVLFGHKHTQKPYTKHIH